MRKTAFIFFLILFFLPFPVLARLGVGVGTGKIQVEDILKPGIIYTLPDFAVLNTGDIPSDYEIFVDYHQAQPEHQPPRGWFTFDPSRFHLEPGKVQMIHTKLNLPVKTIPGKYFAYVEAHPVQNNAKGETVVGIAAATKLYFTVAPANWVLGVYYRLISLWKEYLPWTDRVAKLLAFIFVLIAFRRFFKIEVKGSTKKKDENGEKEK